APGEKRLARKSSAVIPDDVVDQVLYGGLDLLDAPPPFEERSFVLREHISDTKVNQSRFPRLLQCDFVGKLRRCRIRKYQILECFLILVPEQNVSVWPNSINLNGRGVRQEYYRCECSVQ